MASGRDRQKVDEYLEGVRGVVEQQLERIKPSVPEWTPLSGSDWKRPPAGIPPKQRRAHASHVGYPRASPSNGYHPRRDVHECDGFSRQNFTFLDGVKNDHHGMSHHKTRFPWSTNISP